MKTGIGVDARALESLREAALDQRPVTGGTHEFYRYPARFAPAFARAAIESFTDTGDLVIDPFVGGGTSLVEAQRTGRPSFGSDINPLAIFVARAKTTLYSTQALRQVQAWASQLDSVLDVRKPSTVPEQWTEAGYLRNFTGRETWAIRKFIAQALASLEGLSDNPRQFARCALLKTAQWALDLRDETPSAGEFKVQLSAAVSDMTLAAREHRAAVRTMLHGVDCTVIERRAEHLANTRQLRSRTPRLVLTSPPYPGVYVLYHRWKIHARKETPLPYWIANSQDGRGLSHYILGPREEANLRHYYENLSKAFQATVSLSSPETWFVQVVGFNEPEWQLPRYLEALEQAGLKETLFSDVATHEDGRLWRKVPGRRWFAKNQETASNTGREVVLFHRPR